MAYYKKNEKQPSTMVKNMARGKNFPITKRSPVRHNTHEIMDKDMMDKPGVAHSMRQPRDESAKPSNLKHPSLKRVNSKQNPIGVIASYFSEQSWYFEQFNDNELLLDIAGEWCRYRFCFSFIPERQFFYVTARIELPLPEKAKDHYSFLLQELNESMKLGHVDLSPEDFKPVWRCLLPLRGTKTLTLGQLADVLEEALCECDKIYPAFQLFVWGGYNADEAVASVLFPVVGSA